MQKVAFFTQEQAFALIHLLIEKEEIVFPKLDKSWAENEVRIDQLDGIGETLLALLRQLTGDPGIKPSEAGDLMKLVKEHDEKLKKEMDQFAEFLEDSKVNPSDRN